MKKNLTLTLVEYNHEHKMYVPLDRDQYGYPLTKKAAARLIKELEKYIDKADVKLLDKEYEAEYKRQLDPALCKPCQY